MAMNVKLVNLLDGRRNILYNCSQAELEDAVASGSISNINAVDGHFVAVAVIGRKVRLARTLSAIGRYFVARRDDDVFVVVSDRIRRSELVRKVYRKRSQPESLGHSPCRCLPRWLKQRPVADVRRLAAGGT